MDGSMFTKDQKIINIEENYFIRKYSYSIINTYSKNILKHS